MQNQFHPGDRGAIDVRGFIQKNYTPYEGGADFLCPPTARTRAMLAKVQALLRAESEKGGVLDIDTCRVSSLLTYPAGYIDRENELIVGLQTDAPLKRGVNPFGGIRMARAACEAYGYHLSDKIEQEFQYRTTHNDGVFRVYTDEMRKARHMGILTGLPDAYGRGRIIGDYRRLALYGADFLIAEKKAAKEAVADQGFSEHWARYREEHAEQIRALGKLVTLGEIYGLDLRRPAATAQEAVQWTYMAYLASVKSQDGAAMSIGRLSAFLDVYIERDLAAGTLTESEAQEIIDALVIKLRIVRFLRKIGRASCRERV